MGTLIGAAVILGMRRVGMSFEIVDIGWFECIFIIFDGNWPYLVLLVVDISNVALHIWAIRTFFNDIKLTIVCYLEYPILTNAMFIMIIIGFVILFRPLVMILHFKFGPSFWRWARRKCPCFKRFDPI